MAILLVLLYLVFLGYLSHYTHRYTNEVILHEPEDTDCSCPYCTMRNGGAE